MRRARASDCNGNALTAAAARARAQDAQAAVARLTESKKEEAAARRALSAAEEALERVLEHRRALERVACADCVKLRELGTDSPACARLRFETCTDCLEPYCDACFGAMTTCDRCGDRNHCRDCCRGRHGDAGDESCEEDSLCEAY